MAVIVWPSPQVPVVPGHVGPVLLHDTATGRLLESAPGERAGLYVCGITPYDATHMGHASTYVAFDLLNRAWRDAGKQVRYVQNITDVDDPLLERAAATGVTWQQLAAREIALFGEDMTALGVIPPEVYLGAVETVPLVVDAVQALEARGAAYRVPVTDPEGVAGAEDVYFCIDADPEFGAVSGYSHEVMLALFAERGGDPERAGKKNALDPLLWRGRREGEPYWDGGSLGQGRPGWHIECTAIALANLDHPFSVNGGGSDLIFPHHEMGVSHANVLVGPPYARVYAHTGMVGLHGEKMSKSKGNLVKVSVLRAEGVDPMAIRLAILAHHYRSDWMWTDQVLADAVDRLETWRSAMSRDGGPAADATIAAIRAAISDDLNAAAALAAVDDWCARSLAADGSDFTEGAPGLLSRAVNAILGIRF